MVDIKNKAKDGEQLKRTNKEGQKDKTVTDTNCKWSFKLKRWSGVVGPNIMTVGLCIPHIFDSSYQTVQKAHAKFNTGFDAFSS